MWLAIICAAYTNYTCCLVVDGMQFMLQFDLTRCLGIRQKFTSIDRDINADGNEPQKSIYLRRKRDGPQTSTLPKGSENHEFVNAGIFMEPSFFIKATEQRTSEYRSLLKAPKFLVEKSNHQLHRCPVSILLCPLQILVLHPMLILCPCYPIVQPLFWGPEWSDILLSYVFYTDFNYITLLWWNSRLSYLSI